MLREIAEEIGWRAHVLGIVGHATQFLFAESEGYVAVRATYFRARLIERSPGQCEHDLVWLPAGDAIRSLARESDAWAISLVRPSS